MAELQPILSHAAEQHRHELWKPVVGLEGIYEVSDHGRIRRLSRDKKRRYPRHMYLNPRTTVNGYYRVCLRRDRENVRDYIHRLVAMAFLGPPEFPRAQVNHKDGVKTHNHISNLEWVNDSEQISHAYRIGLRSPSCKPGRSPNAKLSNDKVAVIKWRILNGESLTKIAADVGVNICTISDIKHGRSWGHVSARKARVENENCGRRT